MNKQEDRERRLSQHIDGMLAGEETGAATLDAEALSLVACARKIRSLRETPSPEFTSGLRSRLLTELAARQAEPRHGGFRDWLERKFTGGRVWRAAASFAVLLVVITAVALWLRAGIAPTVPATGITAMPPEPAGRALVVSFDDGGYGPMVLRYGPLDARSPSNPSYTVRVRDDMARYQAPERPAGTAYTGYLDLPAGTLPLAGDLVMEWTFSNAGELLSLGNNDSMAWAVAGGYLKFSGGDGGLDSPAGYWAGYYWDARTGPVSIIRQGTDNLVSEPFTARGSVTYRLFKTGTSLQLWANYDSGPWHLVGAPLAVTLPPGVSDTLDTAHVRIGDSSGRAIDVAVGRILLKGTGISALTS